MIDTSVRYLQHLTAGGEGSFVSSSVFTIREASRNDSRRGNYHLGRDHFQPTVARGHKPTAAAASNRIATSGAPLAYFTNRY